MALVSPPMDKPLNIYEAVMEDLRSKRVPQKEIARGSGVPFSTLTKIAQGQIKSPSVHHVQAIYDFFNTREAA